MSISNVTPAPTLIGKQLGPYLLTRSLGRGGSARVYQGLHVQLATDVAVKVLRAPYTATGLKQLRNEAVILPGLKHRHIVCAFRYHFGEVISFLALEYAPHGTLRDRHPMGTQLPLQTIVSYVRQIACALQYIHNTGLIHRDVKPDNMLVARDGRILLADFGIATPIDKSLEEGENFGTAPYAAPEQIRGEPCAASDQYALAITVYEWVSGNPPFEGTSRQIMQQHLYATPPALSNCGREIPHAIERVVMKALAKDPARRFRSVQEFALALEQAYIQIARERPIRHPYPYTARYPIRSTGRELPVRHTTRGSMPSREELFNQVALPLMSTVLLK